MTEYRIPERNMARLNKDIDKLAKRAKRLDLPAPAIEVLGEEFVEEPRLPTSNLMFDATDKVTVKYFVVKPHGEAPLLNGWALIAIIDHFTTNTGNPDKEPTNILRRIPGTDEIEIPAFYRGIDTRCDHCETNRYRRDTFALFNAETNEWRVVGRSCLKDFTGHTSPESLANYYEFYERMFRHAERDEGGANEATHYLPTLKYLSHVAAIIKDEGWVPRGKAREWDRSATADVALYNMMPDAHVTFDELVEVTAEHVAAAERAVNVVRAMIISPDMSDYLWNVAAALEDDHFHWKNMGLVASAVWVFALRDEHQPKNSRPSEFVGRVGKRLRVLVLKVTRRLDFDGDFGMVSVHLFEDKDGNVFVWKTGSVHLDDGTAYTLDGTVKEHLTYNGSVKQTVLTRCRVAKEVRQGKYWKAQEAARETNGHTGALKWKCPFCKQTIVNKTGHRDQECEDCEEKLKTVWEGEEVNA